ncbi:hypothetical protein QE152_g13146 [Popillia japonica]|uniref:Uncharacterized protein n=1 Tax=Popillia japonica TaxID=7064 RepID=A0AAW1LG06_POPJA
MEEKRGWLRTFCAFSNLSPRDSRGNEGLVENVCSILQAFSKIGFESRNTQPRTGFEITNLEIMEEKRGWLRFRDCRGAEGLVENVCSILQSFSKIGFESRNTQSKTGFEITYLEIMEEKRGWLRTF